MADRVPDDDKALRIGSGHGADTKADEKSGYARNIGPRGEPDESRRGARAQDAVSTYTGKKHPSVNLESRARGYGIGGGYERPYRKEPPKPADSPSELYGPLPPSGYYGTGLAARPFKLGQAGFNRELSWYHSQYGEITSEHKK